MVIFNIVSAASTDHKPFSYYILHICMYSDFSIFSSSSFHFKGKGRVHVENLKIAIVLKGKILYMINRLKFQIRCMKLKSCFRMYLETTIRLLSYDLKITGSNPKIAYKKIQGKTPYTLWELCA